MKKSDFHLIKAYLYQISSLVIRTKHFTLTIDSQQTTKKYRTSNFQKDSTLSFFLQYEHRNPYILVNISLATFVAIVTQPR